MKKAEVLIVGAGPAGLSAAIAAANHGRKVIVLDDNSSAGGQIWRSDAATSTEPLPAKKQQAIAALQTSGAELLTGHTVLHAETGGKLRAMANGAAETFSFDQLVLATGARERFLPFPGWTLPGIFGAGGLQALVKGGYSVHGKRIVVAGTGPLLIAVAAYLRQQGAAIVRIAEQAPLRQLLPFSAQLLSHPAKILEGIRYQLTLANVPFTASCWPVAAEGTPSLTSVRLTNGEETWDEPCDLLACGFHLAPNLELPSLLGCALEDGLVQTDTLQRTSVSNIFCAGEPTGIAGLDAALVQGQIAGLAAAGAIHQAEAPALQKRRKQEQSFGKHLATAFRLRPELLHLAADDTLLCRCEDVPFGRVRQYSSWTDAKLQTRCGMGPCQGRVCGPITQALFGWQPGSVRPPIYPMPLSAICGPIASAIPEFELEEETQ